MAYHIETNCLAYIKPVGVCFIGNFCGRIYGNVDLSLLYKAAAPSSSAITSTTTTTIATMQIDLYHGKATTLTHFPTKTDIRLHESIANVLFRSEDVLRRWESARISE